MSDQPGTSRTYRRRDELSLVEKTSDNDESTVLDRSQNVISMDRPLRRQLVTNVTTQDVTNVYQDQTTEELLIEPSDAKPTTRIATGAKPSTLRTREPFDVEDKPTTRKVTGAEPSTGNIERLCSQLKEVSRKLASESCGADDSILDDQNVRIAELELVKQTEESDLEGHFHHRKDVMKRFNTPPTTNIHHSQLFHEAEDQAVRESGNCRTRQAKRKLQLVHGNIVGQVGIGKSTFSKLMVREILEKNLYEFVFYLHFRNPNYKKEMNLPQCLTNDSTFSKNLAEENQKQLLTKLEENENICVILDGYDESEILNNREPIKGRCSVFDSVKSETAIKHLLNGDLFPNAKKLFTSRPPELFQLHKTYRPHFIVSMCGLNETSHKQIRENVCENDDVCTKVLKFVNNRPDFSNTCGVPVHCLLLMYCISVNLNTVNVSSLEKLDSLSNILVATLALFAENIDHLRGKEFRAKKLSLLAFKTFLQNQLVFEQKDLDRFGIGEHEASAFLTTRIRKKVNLKLMKGQAHLKSYFSHLLFHEFFAASYFILFKDLDEFEQTLSYHEDSNFEMVAKFAFGLCNSTTQRHVHETIPSYEFDPTHVQRKKELLKKLKQVDSVEKFGELPQVLSWLHEMRDDELSEEVVSNLKSEFLVQLDNGLLSNTPAYQCALQWRKKNLYLYEEFHDYVSNDWNQFTSAFDESVQSGKVKIKKFVVRFGEEEFKDDDARQVASCLRDVKALQLWRCNMTLLGIEALSLATKQNKQIRKLDLGDNKFGDDGAMHLAKCITKVVELKLYECSIEAKVELLSQGIMRRDHPIRKHDLGDNKFGDDGAMHLAKCVTKVVELKLCECNIEARGMKLLSQGIMQKDHPMPELDLGDNKFGDDGAMHLAKCITKVEELGLNNCEIGAKGMELLSQRILGRDHPIRKLDFGESCFGDNGAVHLAKCITKVEKLELYDCGIGARGVELLSQGIMRRDHPLTLLHLNWSNLSDDGAKYLELCLHKIRKLHVGGCDISLDVLRSLQHSSAECQVMDYW